jgi:hypothetical protein
MYGKGEAKDLLQRTVSMQQVLRVAQDDQLFFDVCFFSVTSSVFSVPSVVNRIPS